MNQTVAALRTLIRTVEGSPLRDYWSCSGVAPGLPKGAITQVFGPGKTEFAVRFLREHPDLKVAWIEPTLSIYPSGILQRKVAMNRILFIESGKEFPWAVWQAVKSSLFEGVILTAAVDDLRLLRRFQLAVEKGGTSLILLSEYPSNSWPVALQLKSSRNQGGRINIDVIRKK
ncbi:MAG TPA: hypothetical protein VN944_04575 [Nitrospiria bacterium]|nr:hypothetical protein [Nitrospiria bacterium]